LPIHSIKIDRSFISDIHENDDDKAITKAIIALGIALNLNIIAEGVEQKEQLDFLTAQDCSLIQGYLFSKPVTAEEVLSLLKQPQTVLNKIDNTKVSVA
jgi:EAL domain-containing protein (putative c-di-GMP-specific phosphodiesterase class I)